MSIFKIFGIKSKNKRKKNQLFDEEIEPACDYCVNGKKSENGMVLCAKVGVVSPSYHCKKFVYNPLKRKPKKVNYKLPKFFEEDFKI